MRLGNHYLPSFLWMNLTISTMGTTRNARPSGMAATARETATMKVSRMTFRWKSPAVNRLNAKMKTQMPRTSLDSRTDRSSSFFCGLGIGFLYISSPYKIVV